MKETICTIPINDIFMPKCGCPFCRMESMLEEQMFEKGQKLPNALILESHLQEIIDNDVPKKLKGKPDKKQLEVIKKRLDSCYVCDRIEWDMHHFCDTIFVEWAKGEEFYKLYNEQPFICFKHYDFIMNVATQKSKLPSKLLPQFYAETAGLTKKYLLSLKEDITYFCSMFDYRNHGKDWGSSKDSIERSIEFLTGEKP